MKKIAMRLLSMLIVLSMVMSFAPLTALAANENPAPAAVNDSFDLSAIKGLNLLKTEGVDLDEDDPAIIAASKELDNMKVLGADGDPVPLTEEQKQQVLYLFQQYLDQWEDNADILGVQTPFFLAYNDNNDELGILGELLAMNNVPVDAVRAGYMSFDDLTGMITTFYYADQLGIKYYGSAVKNARDEILDLVEASGAKTDAQKYLVINNWLAQNVTFDMEFIMNADKDTNGDGVIDANDDNTDTMIAPNPQKRDHYDDVYNTMYNLYEKQIRDQFEGQIRTALEAEFKNRYYNEAIKQGYYQAVYAEVETQVEQSIYQQAYDAVYQDAYDQAYAEYMAENGPHTHEYTEEITTPATCEEAGVKTFTCACGHTYTEEIPATGHTDADENEICDTCEKNLHEHSYTEEITTPATCEEAGVKTFTCACEHTYTEEIPATGHADANEDGTCDNCNEPMPIVGDGEGEGQEGVNADGDEMTELEAAADAYAKEQAEAAADAAGNAAVEENADAIAEQADAVATDETNKFLEENADAIAADPVAFCETAFGADAAAQIAAGWDQFWADAQTNGVEVDPVNAPGVKMTVDQIVAQQMDTPQEDPMLQKPDGSYMTPNEAIPVFADQAAVGLTNGVFQYWQGSQFGALGYGNAVCLGYTKAFTYLVQCMKSDIYTTNGNIDNAANWKTAEELYYTNGELDVTKNYPVDTVRISFDSDVTMFGETQANFTSDHFWNAVQIDGQWFYVDPCYVDVYIEVMMRDRVETDGNVNHMYFLFSHDTAAELYDGNYSDIKSLYGTGTGMGTDLEASASPADSTAYEDSWISRIKSNPAFENGVAYYVYNSTDLISLMQDNNMNNPGSGNGSNPTEVDLNDFEVKLVSHALTNTDEPDIGDTDYTTYIEFNYFENEDDEESEARVRDAKGNMVKSEMLTALYEDHKAACEIYPSLAISSALYNGKLYFNLDTSLLYYDLETCEVVRVKEYNTVYGVRDDTMAFGGMAFSATDNADSADFTVYNHPISGISLKDDGNLYVSVATNFAHISGKDSVDDASSYGYEFEESNYNPNYNSYVASMYGGMGSQETNDNDEFMWATNFVEKLSMSELAGTRHSYEDVSVAATCRHNAFTESRCSDCGLIEADTRVEEEGTAHDHHFVYFEETYYTKDDNGNPNTGNCYVCTECGYAISEPTKPEENDQYGNYGTSYEEQMEIYEAELAIYNAAKEAAGHTYVPTDATWASDNSTVTFRNLECSAICPERAATLDCLVVNDQYNAPISVRLSSSRTVNASIIETIGTCPEGLVQVWDASGTVTENNKDYAYTLTRTVTLDKTECKFEGGFCPVCGDCTVHRISGEDRITTSRVAAEALKETLGVESFNTIIVANGWNFADALTGSYLATVKNAPILLHDDKNLDANVAYITGNLADNGTVYILGGINSVSASLEDALEDQDITVKRLAGNDRFETNLAILTEAGVDDEEILVCTAYNFADSLSASATGLPMLLVDKTLTENQVKFLAALEGNAITVIGGVNSVPETIETALAEYSDTVTRIAGETREETSIKVAAKYFDDPTSIVLAYSRNYPDGLCGGPLAYALKAPLVLTNAGAEAVAVEYAAEHEITSGLILGGVNSVSDATAKKVFNLTGEGVIPAL
ncbi:MAG: cell wall-binding repeat-containing protein [Oscillospiraceae bacterium]|nr:cell wall-binding repeat-containing protein [Oscillospiraceae bacterium]